ncbi:MAG: hypothetical protein WCO05_01965 [Candidatus Moraniibacteriota bacterium]
MQKIIKISAVLLAIVFLAGCGKRLVSQTQSVVPVATVNQSATNQIDVAKQCQNFPPPSFCPGGVGDIIVIGNDSDGCSTYGCKPAVAQEPTQQMPATQQPIFGTSEQQAFDEGKCDEFIDYSGGGVTANIKSQCIKQKAIRENNLELCQTIAIDYEKQWCIKQIAVQRKDKKLCYLLNEADWCLSSLSIELADKCDISSKGDCEAKADCFWKYAGGKIKAQYSCCPKDVKNSPQRCNVMVD